MRNPMSWSLPLFRAFGIMVRVHVGFFIITLGLFLRTAYSEGSYVAPLDAFLFTIVLLFGIVLLHEFGHCFGGRYVGGEAEEILIWPLGGLAYVSVPHNWKAHTFMIAAGPFVNVLICFVTAVAIAGAGFLPNINPVSEPYVCEIKNYRDGRIYSSEYGVRLYEPGSSESMGYARAKPERCNELVAERPHLERALAPGWIVWLQRTFWLSWILFLFNLLPAYPLDGGQILQGILWGRTDYRRGTTVAAYSGLIFGMVLLAVGLGINETLLFMLSIFMIFSSYQKLRQLDMEENPFGYDFSAGYTSLEADEDAPPKRRRHGFFKRWMMARTARRLQREAAQRELDEIRMDQLLEKIARSGKQSLTDEERHFMERVSERYRK